MASAYYLLTHSSSIPHLTMLSSPSISHQHLKSSSSSALCFRVPKNRSRLRLVSMRQGSKGNRLTCSMMILFNTQLTYAHGYARSHVRDPYGHLTNPSVTMDRPMVRVSSHAHPCIVPVSEVTSESWNTSILESETPVVVEFYTSWCGPCQMVHRVMDEIATDYNGKLKCVAVNVDQEPHVAEEYDIKAVPIVLLFKNGEKCESVVGTMPKEFFVAAIERVLAS
ncbi:hypothetical protein OSB04_030608 [Centaurea solstitialis]|uniref:Thioredoxin domain-containing protein n=1 Tax=Centaurea solstitialis TaxID=347529 RepID=A0AA38W3Z9_9ASTR|nr:hypothetical protein OSB04_030608 [Centaurea solstitialis]